MKIRFAQTLCSILAEIYDALSRFATITNARDLRTDLANALKKTMALRKAVRVNESKQDEVTVEPDEEVDVCAECGCESTDAETDSWIACDK